jgi:hypothetical protein
MRTDPWRRIRDSGGCWRRSLHPHIWPSIKAAMGQVSVKQHEKSEMPYLDGGTGFMMISSIMCAIGKITMESFGG